MNINLAFLLQHFRFAVKNPFQISGKNTFGSVIEQLLEHFITVVHTAVKERFGINRFKTSGGWSKIRNYLLNLLLLLLLLLSLLFISPTIFSGVFLTLRKS
jgi:hypothetical protein